MAGNTTGRYNSEHFLYNAKDGTYLPFGEYPSKNLENERKFSFDFKHTAGRSDKPYIWNFYENHNLIRQYNIEGQLLQEIYLKISKIGTTQIPNLMIWKIVHIGELFRRLTHIFMFYSILEKLIKLSILQELSLNYKNGIGKAILLGAFYLTKSMIL